MAVPNDAPIVACFEIEPPELEYLQQRLQGVELRATASPLNLETADLAGDAAFACIFIRSCITEEVLAQLPALRGVATRSTGFDHIDLATCRTRGIVVSNVPTYGENTVAEHTFGLILALSRKIHQAYERTIRGDFSLVGLRGFDLKGRTLGVVGTGHIGLHVIRIGRGFGMDVLATDTQEQGLLAEVLGFRYVQLDTLIEQADVLTLHLPYLASTHHIINRERLGRMKHGSLLINTARGALVDTEALLWALNEGRLAGAGLDVIEGEELFAEEERLLDPGTATERLQAAIRGHVLMRREDVVITPHIAFDSQEALDRILETTAANLRALRDGEPRNVVNP